MISDSVKVGEKPSVYLSGGLDSAIILHHLKQKSKEPIATYTFGFPNNHTFLQARKVAQHYGVGHSTIMINEMLPWFPKILKDFDRPRFALWPYFLAQAVSQDKRVTCYVGEGCDEHFGGYPHKKKMSYLEVWSDHYTYARYIYSTVHDLFGLRLEMPFSDLNFMETSLFYDRDQNKKHLREAYRGVLPDWIVDMPKTSGGLNYFNFWRNELHKEYPEVAPQTIGEIRELLNRYAVEKWLETREG